MRSVSGTNGPPTRRLPAAVLFFPIHAEIGQHAADAFGLGVEALFERVERRGLPRLDAVERSRQPRQRALDAGGRGFRRQRRRARDAVGSSRDSSRASRSGGAVKITVSLIGDAFSVAAGLSARSSASGGS